MEFNLEIPHNQLFIRSISERGIRINDDYYDSPFILTGQKIVPEWNVASMEDINEETLQIIFEMQPEVVLLGIGKTQLFLPPATQSVFFRRNVGFEVMVTDAACRTFNVLVAEGRHVVAALMPVIS